MAGKFRSINAGYLSGDIDHTVDGLYTHPAPVIAVQEGDEKPSYLLHKLDQGSNITLSVVTVNQSQRVRIDAAGGAVSDELVKISGTDTTASRLEDKIVQGSNMTITKLNSGGDEQLQLNVTGVVSDELVKASATDTTPDELDAKIVQGANVTITKLNPGGNEQLQISATGGGSGSWVGLTDTPSSLAGQQYKIPRVNSAEDALELVSEAPGTKVTVGITDIIGDKTLIGGQNIQLVPNDIAKTITFNALHNVSAFDWKERVIGHVNYIKGTSGAPTGTPSSSPEYCLVVPDNTLYTWNGSWDAGVALIAGDTLINDLTGTDTSGSSGTYTPDHYYYISDGGSISSRAPNNNEAIVMENDPLHGGSTSVYVYDDGLGQWIYYGQYNYAPDATTSLKGISRLAIHGEVASLVPIQSDDPRIDAIGLYQIVTAGVHAAQHGHVYFVDTTGGTVTLNLPASPQTGDYVGIVDSNSNFDSVAVNVGRNGNPIMGLNEDMTCDVKNASFRLVFADGVRGWRIED
jgi:hypothetical protein